MPGASRKSTPGSKLQLLGPFNQKFRPKHRQGKFGSVFVYRPITRVILVAPQPRQVGWMRLGTYMPGASRKSTPGSKLQLLGPFNQRFRPKHRQGEIRLGVRVPTHNACDTCLSQAQAGRLDASRDVDARGIKKINPRVKITNSRSIQPKVSPAPSRRIIR